MTKVGYVWIFKANKENKHGLASIKILISNRNQSEWVLFELVVQSGFNVPSDGSRTNWYKPHTLNKTNDRTNSDKTVSKLLDQSGSPKTGFTDQNKKEISRTNLGRFVPVWYSVRGNLFFIFGLKLVISSL